MKPLATAAALLCLLGLSACAPGADPVPTPTGETTTLEPEVGATGEAELPEALPDGAYLRIRTTAHLAAGGILDLVLTSYEPTIESATSTSTISAISDGCFLYDDHRAYLEGEAGVEHYYSTSELQVTGDATLDSTALVVLGLGMDAQTETGSSVLVESEHCYSFARGAGTATLSNYFSTFGYESLNMAMQWQVVGFSDLDGPAATNVTFDNCSVEYSEHALEVTRGDYQWQLRNEGWRCAVAPAETE